ncbi:MAG TPA: hypothetical protein VHC90_05760 [Bryobacteraceae bacterium]|nr:hypothetical protein [Bryobacteraceae bacterium]
MADSFDPKLVPDLLRATLSVSIGAAYKSLEMIARPTESFPKVVAEVTGLMTVPEGTGDTLPEKVQAMAGVWLARGAHMVVDCKATGDKFTEGK